MYFLTSLRNFCQDKPCFPARSWLGQFFPEKLKCCSISAVVEAATSSAWSRCAASRAALSHAFTTSPLTHTSIAMDSFSPRPLSPSPACQHFWSWRNDWIASCSSTCQCHDTSRLLPRDCRSAWDCAVAEGLVLAVSCMAKYLPGFFPEVTNLVLDTSCFFIFMVS